MSKEEVDKVISQALPRIIYSEIKSIIVNYFSFDYIVVNRLVKEGVKHVWYFSNDDDAIKAFYDKWKRSYSSNDGGYRIKRHNTNVWLACSECFDTCHCFADPEYFNHDTPLRYLKWYTKLGDDSTPRILPEILLQKIFTMRDFDCWKYK
jgi:hypothetical protein